MKKPTVGSVSLGKASVGKISLETDAGREAKLKAIEDLTENAEKEIGLQLQKIREFEAKYKEKREFDGDAGYYFSVVFESREQRDAFLKARGLTLTHDDHILYDELKHCFT